MGSLNLKQFGFFTLLLFVNILSILPLLSFDAASIDLTQSVYNTREILAGRIPYLEIVSHHFMGYLLPFVMVNLFLDLTPTVLWSMCIIFNLINALILYHSIKLVTSQNVARLGALATVSLGWFWGWQGMTFNVQSNILPLLNLAIYFLIHACTTDSKRSGILCALFLGLSFIADQRMLVFAPLLLLPIWHNNWWRKKQIICSLGVSYIFAPLLALTLLWSLGAWDSFIEHTIKFPLQSRNCSNPYALQMLQDLLSWGVASERPTVVIATIGFLLTLFYEKRTWLKIFFIYGLFAALLYSLLGQRDYPNYLLLFAPFALLLLCMALHLIKLRFSALILPLTLLILALIVRAAAISPIYYSKSGRYLYPFDNRAVKETVAFIKEHRKKSEEVLVWGYAPAIYNFSSTLSPFKDVGLLSVTGANFFTYDSSEQCYLPEMVAEFEALMSKNPPKYFIRFESLGRNCEEFSDQCAPPHTDYSRTFGLINYDYDKVPHLKFLKEIIERDYTLQTTLEYPLEKVRIYSLKSDAVKLPVAIRD